MPDPLFTGLNHVCVVTNDIDRTVCVWADKYGIGPWNLYTFDTSNMSSKIYGKPVEFAMRVGLCSVSQTFRVEIIQPLDDRSPYATSLAQHNNADHIHHLRMEIGNYRDAIERLNKFGFERPLEARFSGAPGVEGIFEGTYFSTESDLGFMVEVGHATSGFAMAPPESVYPPSRA